MASRFSTSIWRAGDVAAVILALTPALAFAQQAPDSPQAGGQLRLPPGATTGPLSGMPLGPVLTPAQKIVAALPPPAPGVLPPRPPLPKDAAMPSADPRDLQGTWVHNQPLLFRSQTDMYGVAAPYTMTGAKVLERRCYG